MDGIRAMLHRVVETAEQSCLGIGSICEFGQSRPELLALHRVADRRLKEAAISRIAEAQVDGLDDVPALHYRDASQPAVEHPAAMPVALQGFARQAVEAALRDVDAIDRALGESMTEPKSNVWFEPGELPQRLQGVRLDRRTRMLYDARHLYINGESFRAGGRDATLMRRLADQRSLDARDLARASEDAVALLGDWCEAGWAHAA